MIILDTNVVSEFMRTEPDADVLAWLDSISRDEVWTTATTISEISAGIAALPIGKRRTRLDSGFNAALRAFDGRILSFTVGAALHYGPIVAGRHAAGRPISVADAQIAAIAAHVKGTVATRNIKDYASTGVGVLDPWAPHQPQP